MNYILRRSPEAERVHFDALKAVDYAEHRRGPMTLAERDESYLLHAGHLCHQRMLEELEPINAWLVKIAAMTIGPLTVPPEIEAWRQSIMDRWHKVAQELLGPLPQPLPPIGQNPPESAIRCGRKAP